MSPEVEHRDPLGDGFKWRLRAELNRLRPPYSSPRYLSTPREQTGGRRLAAATLTVAVVGTLSLTAYAATGSPNPAVWTHQIVTRIGPVRASPPPVATDSPPPGRAAPAPPAHAQPTPGSEPSQRPGGTPSTEHEPGDDNATSGARTDSPSPYAGDH